MNRRKLVKLIGLAPIATSLIGIEHSDAAVTVVDNLFSWRHDLPPLATWTYANGKFINTDVKRKNLAKNVCKYPISVVISVDQRHLTGEVLPNYDIYRDTIRETNPRVTMLAHLNASESHTPSSPGQRVIHSIGGEYGIAANEPQNNPGTIWFERPKGHVVIQKNRWGPKAMMDFRLQRARDALFAAMETQYLGGYSGSAAGRRWDGLFLDQLIVPGLRWGTSQHERSEMLAGLQLVLTRFHMRFPDAIVIGNSPVNFHDINGELNEGRVKRIGEVSRSAGHSEPEINVYMYKPGRSAPEQKIATELDLARKYGAFFSYHYGVAPFNYNPWPKTFSRLLDSYPKWRDYLVKLSLDIS